MSTHDIVVPNQFSTIQSRLAILLGLRDEEVRHELQHGWDHRVRTEWLVDFIHVRALNATGESYQRDACHGFLLLIFGTILFPYSSNLIDGALAQGILQVVGGHSYVEAVLTETIRSLDYVREVRRGFYEFKRFDACRARALFVSFISWSIPLTRSGLSQLPQHTWRSSIRRDSHLFVIFAWLRFHGHHRQTFQMQRVLSKELFAQSCKPSGRSEINSAANLWIYVQRSLTT
ncbi:hypothetical protein CRG98_021351 [Punica granatum]|uniref:DUF7745 domain-containing protein n=1 Tax=Punica granatum TaxID=22663 RepID=A0A2I0JPP2_PUNGR|nr:hypothetical protein CRG98_021351 [Punica granatum]